MSDSYNSHNDNSSSTSEAQQMLDAFWPKALDEIKNLNQNDFKNQELPLARIKKIMKLDEDVKMISAEAPVLFAKAAEIFITEISLRAWIHTEDNKRRTLQRNDIAMAITKYDQFDFLIDIVPRDELKPATKRNDGTINNANATSMNAVAPDQIQYYLQLAQQTQAALTQQGVATQGHQIQLVQTNPSATGAQQFTMGTPQLLQLQMPTNNVSNAGGGDVVNQQQAAQMLQLAGQAGVNAGGGQVLLQQVSANGVNDVQKQIPIQLTQQQLQAIQAQLQAHGGGNQQIIISAPMNAALNHNSQTHGHPLTHSIPQYQIATNAGGQQFLQTVVASGASNVGQVTAQQTHNDANASPHLDDDAET